MEGTSEAASVSSVSVAAGSTDSGSKSNSNSPPSSPLAFSDSPDSSINMETVMPLRLMELLKSYWGITWSRPSADTFRENRPRHAPMTATAAEAAAQRFFWKELAFPESSSSQKGISAMAMRPKLLKIISIIISEKSVSTPPALTNTRAGRIKLK